MADIPSQLSFEHMLAHLFPGFFTALTVFMILDIYTPLNITKSILGDFNALMVFLGFIFIVGTILGVIIDGFHHRFIEMWFFSFIDQKITSRENDSMKHISIKEIEDHLQKQLKCDEKDKECKECKFNKKYGYEILKLYYAFDFKDIDKCVSLHDYLRRTIYHYYEFYANTFIAMIPFSFFAPIYIVKILNIDFNFAKIVGIILIAVTTACLDFAWMAYDRWIATIYFAFCRCVKGRTLGNELNER